MQSNLYEAQMAPTFAPTLPFIFSQSQPAPTFKSQERRSQHPGLFMSLSVERNGFAVKSIECNVGEHWISYWLQTNLLAEWVRLLHLNPQIKDFQTWQWLIFCSRLRPPFSISRRRRLATASPTLLLTCSETLLLFASWPLTSARHCPGHPQTSLTALPAMFKSPSDAKRAQSQRVFS